MRSFACTECGSVWNGYHSWMFCQLKKWLGGRYPEKRLSDAARIIDCCEMWAADSWNCCHASKDNSVPSGGPVIGTERQAGVETSGPLPPRPDAAESDSAKEQE